MAARAKDPGGRRADAELRAKAKADREAMRRKYGVLITAADREHAAQVAVDLEVAAWCGLTPNLIATEAQVAEAGRKYDAMKRPAPLRADLAALAVKHLGDRFSILEERGMDSLDFHDASVLGVRDLLLAAFELGRKSNARDFRAAGFCPGCDQPSHPTKRREDPRGFPEPICANCLETVRTEIRQGSAELAPGFAFDGPAGARVVIEVKS